MRDFTSKQTTRVAKYDFRLDGVKFTAQMSSDSDSLLEFSELAEASLATEAELQTAAGAAFTSRFFKAVLPAGEYARFRAHLKQHKTHPDTLLELMGALNEWAEEAFEDEAERPTTPASSSSAGRVATDERRLQIVAMAGAEGEVEYADAAPPKPARPVHQQRTQRRKQQTKKRSA